MTEVTAPGNGYVFWLDEQHLITCRTAGGARALHCFDLVAGMGSRLPAAGSWSIGYIRPVDSKTGRLAWIDLDAEDRPERLRIWDLAAGRDARPPIDLPRLDLVRECTADWVEAETVALHWRDDDGRLHVLRVDADRGTTKETVSVHQFERWLVVEGLNYAFGLTARGDDTQSLALVALKADRAVALAGAGGYPHVAADAGCSFRVRHLDGKHVLSRLELATARETAVCSVPGGLSLAGVSRSGRTVLLAPGDVFGPMPEYRIIDVATGRTHTIRPTGTFMDSAASYFGALSNVSALSPDGRRVLLAPFVMPGFAGRAAIYTVPGDWP
jgi:hypothetical protein